VIFAYFATVLFVPAFVTKMSPPRRTQAGSGSVRLLDRWIFVLTRNVLRHAKLVGILSLLAAIVLAWSATRVTADARLLDAFDKDEPASTTTRLLEDKLAGIRPLEVMISPNEGSVLSPEVLQRVEEVEHWASTQDGVITVVSYAQPLRAARLAVTDQEESMTRPFASLAHTRALGELLASGEKDPLTAWMSPDEKVARMTVFFRDTGIRRTLRVIESLKEEFEQGSGALRVSFVGEAYTGSVGRDSVLRDLISGLTLALVSIFVLLALLFRSLRLGLVAMPPNIIPLLATGAYMMARGIHLNMATVITFSIGIGLAVDDTVHVVARFLEERRRISSVRVALLRAARGTGRAIVITAISLSLGFSVLMLSEFVSVRQFGELIAVTVLNCLVSALFIQPALLLLVTKSKG
jgi:predicted RND superfamily exporter protein